MERWRQRLGGLLVGLLVGVLIALAPVLAGPAVAATPKPGDHGSAVRVVQSNLVAAGLLPAQDKTGRWGARTTKAVKELQRGSGLSTSGRLNAATKKALARAVARMQGPRNWSTRISIGTSQSGRSIDAYRTGEPGKPVVVVTATMHGEEDFGQYVAQGLLHGRPVRGIDLWVVPVLNPDGLAHDRRWVNGSVDLNRNFPNRWITRANTGPHASSEKETRVIMAFLRKVRPTYLVSWHQPLFGVDSYRVKDRGLMQRLSAGLRIPVRRLDCHGSCHGTMTGWYNENFAGAAITVEYGSSARSMKRMLTTDADAVLQAVGGRRG